MSPAAGYAERETGTGAAAEAADDIEGDGTAYEGEVNHFTLEPWPESFMGSESQAVECSLATLETRLFRQTRVRMVARPASREIKWKGILKNNREFT
jgi:hypothetical protein